MRPFTSTHLTEAAVWRRQAAGARNAYGEFVPGAGTDRDIRVISAPGGASRDPLPEGQRLSDMRTFWLDKTPTRGASDAAALSSDPPRQADVIVYGGAVWRINETLDWGDFWELRTLRYDDAP